MMIEKKPPRMPVLLLSSTFNLLFSMFRYG